LRLNRYLALCGVAARRKCDVIILQGRVCVNGRKVTELGVTVDQRFDVVTVDGKRVGPPGRRTYILMNKPAGYITTVRDPQGRPTVMDLLPKGTPRVFPVGRLDAATTGLLLLTDDGQLAYRLMHPRYKVEKRYIVEVEEHPSPDQLDAISKGVLLEDGRTRPAKARVLESAGPGKGPAKLEITVQEGRKRQIRRMMKAIGLHVRDLERVAFGFLELGDLERGKTRRLDPFEIRKLRKMVGLYPIP